MIKSIVLTSTFLAMAAGLNAASPSASFVGATSTFSVSQRTQVPGETLKPGDYTVRVVDQLADRMIVRVDSSSTSDHAIFLGIPRQGLAEGVSPGPLSWKSGPNGALALRGFEFAPGTTVEFVYPKTEAVDLAKRNDAKVVAIDPESEGKPVLKNMSRDDLQVIHLWMLSLTTASPNDKTPAILAEKYESGDGGTGVTLAGNNVSGPGQRPVEVARLERPRVGPPSPVASRPVYHQQVVAKLPHTAGSMALITLVGLLSFLAAGCIRVLRASMQHAA